MPVRVTMPAASLLRHRHDGSGPRPRSSLLALARRRSPSSELTVELAASDVPACAAAGPARDALLRERRRHPASCACVSIPTRCTSTRTTRRSRPDERAVGRTRSGSCIWRAGDDEARQRPAWQMLADRFEAPRAAWIARATAAAQPAAIGRGSRSPSDAPLPRAPRFPALPPPTAAAARPRCPAPAGPLDRHRVSPAATAVVVVTGRDIRSPRSRSAPDLGRRPTAAADTGEVPAIDEGMRWMIDFDEAEAGGMALRMPLPGAGLARSIFSSSPASRRVRSPTDSAPQLADAPRRASLHRRTRLHSRPGRRRTTPRASARRFSSVDPRGERSFADEWRRRRSTRRADTNGAVAARALGLGGRARGR